VSWLRRYAPAELCGLLGAVAGYLLALAATGHAAPAAYAAAAGENIGFYGFLRARRVGSVRALVVEFGPAEVLDSALVRPACMALATAALGPLGVLAGKLAADLVFYAPVIATYEFLKRGGTGIDPQRVTPRGS
jgi:hypothetical protein